MKNTLCILPLVVALSPVMALAQFTDAISREFSVFNNIAPQPVVADSISREFSIFNDLRGKPVEVTDSVSREFSVLNLLAGTVTTSSGAASALPVAGTLQQQLTALNSTPPPYDPMTWQPVARRDDNMRDAFCSTSEPSPLMRPYVDATLYLAGADEVTFNNTGSAFYRWTFELPCGTRFITLSGSANVDDQGVLWLNGQRVTANMLVPACNPTGDPCAPQSCYTQQDAGKDRVDLTGRRVLTGPSLDSFEHVAGASLLLGPGNLNELIFAVAGNAAPLDPTGVEFSVVALYPLPCPGDADGNRRVEFADVTVVLTNFGLTGPAGDTNATCTVSFSDVTTLLTNFGSSCP